MALALSIAALMLFISLRIPPIVEPAPPSWTKNLIGSSEEEVIGSSGGGCAAEESGCFCDGCGEEGGCSDLGVGRDLRVGEFAFFDFAVPFFEDEPESIGTGSKSGRMPRPLGDVGR
jgi:hypothetical protein